ncbi:MAG: hypothetical protein PHW27_06735 [Melioribacteraceae bacterium]|nr:hypothetical protein [Melioribacteraceae bacterium]
MNGSSNKREDHQQPFVIEKSGWKFHHVGIPTNKVKPDEKFIEKYRMYVSGFETSPYGIEYMRFEEDSPIEKIIKQNPHIAFEVDDLDSAAKDKKLIGEITSPSKGIRVAMIDVDGLPVELIEFNRQEME